MDKLIIATGPSCAGKSTFLKELEKAGAEHVPSFTTRAPREQEIANGTSEYIFCSVDEFWTKRRGNTIVIGENWLYGPDPTVLHEAKETDCNVFMYQAIDAVPVREFYDYIKGHKLNIEIIILDFNLSKKMRTKLLRKRGDSEKSIKTRFKREKEQPTLKGVKLTPDIVVTDFEKSWDKAMRKVYELTETKIVSLVGPSGSGKTTLSTHVAGMTNYKGETLDASCLDDRFHVCVSQTTRELRDGEFEGVDYYAAKSHDFFEDKKNRFIENTTYKGNKYGVLQEEVKLGKVNLVAVEPEGCVQIKKWSKKNKVQNLIAYFNIPEKVRIKQLQTDKKRTPEDVAKRLETVDPVKERWTELNLKANLVFKKSNDKQKKKLLQLLKMKAFREK